MRGVDYPVLRDLSPEMIAPTTFAEWLEQNGVPLAERSVADDPGGFGISNLERYTLGLHPQRPQRADLPVAMMREFRSGGGEEDDYLTITFWETAGAADIECYVEASDDLENWEALYPEEHRTVVRWEGNRGLVTYRDERPVADGARRFLRVSIWFNAEQNEYW